MTSREQFEAWADANGIAFSVGKDAPHQDLWKAWQAARAGMVPKEQLQLALHEGWKTQTRSFETAWDNSKAKKAMEAA